MKDLKAKGQSGNAYAICTASLKKAGKMRDKSPRRRLHAELAELHARVHCKCDACQMEVPSTFRGFAEPSNEYQIGFTAGKAGSQKPCPFANEPMRSQWLRGYQDGFIKAEHAATDKPKWAAFGEGSSTLRGVEIFATGDHRGKPYTEADLGQMVQNFRRYSMPRAGKKGIVSIPAVLGHEEDQSYLERSDLPAAGYATDVWQDRKECPLCQGSRMSEGKPCPMCSGRGEVGVLKANFNDVPPKVARLLKGKTYKQVSAEVYDEPPDEIGGHGKMLRRVAFPGRGDPAGEVARRHPRAGGAQRAA